jgi:hypothetical protein
LRFKLRLSGGGWMRYSKMGHGCCEVADVGTRLQDRVTLILTRCGRDICISIIKYMI